MFFFAHFFVFLAKTHSHIRMDMKTMADNFFGFLVDLYLNKSSPCLRCEPWQNCQAVSGQT